MRAQASFVLVCTLCALGTVATTVGAAELPDAVVRVNRGAGAESCPTEADIVSAILAQAHVPARERGTGKPVVDVVMERYGAAYFATIRVDGGARGVRTIQSEGVDCDPLRDAVVLALLVLLERDAEPIVVPQSAAPAVAPDVRRPRVFLSAGGAITAGEPHDVFVAAMGGAGIVFGQWEAGAVFQWSPPRSIEVEPGVVEVQAWGGTARLCYALPPPAAVRLSGCGLGSLFSLRGTGGSELDDERLQVRPWWRAGLGLEAVVPLGSRVALGAFANVFATLHGETFSIGGYGEAYGTSTFTGHAGVDLRVTLF